MQTQEEVDALLATIAELGGKSFKDDDITYEGERLVVPEKWRGDLNKALDFLRKKIKEEGEESDFSRTFHYRPYDGAICAFRALKRAFGMAAGKTIYTFFGKIPPRYITIPTGMGQVEEVPWGQFTVPLLEDSVFNFGSTHHAEYGEVFEISCRAPRKNRFIIEGLFEMVEQELKVGSIYRGKAIDGKQAAPDFLEIGNLDATRIVYSEQVRADLEANIWTVMKYQDAQRALGMGLKRAILLTGPYGTGKSLAGYLTAREAVAAGWTFIMARPGRDDFLQVVQTARLYQPACVFFEDAETVTSAEQTQSDAISQVLDIFDGIQSKDTSLIVVMTTNHPEKIHKGMHRPGRVDAQIEINALDATGIEALIRAVVSDEMLAEDVEFAPVVDACDGYVPAFVKEVADRAIRYALARTQGKLDFRISTADLVQAANGLRPQFDRMNAADELTLVSKPLHQIVSEGAASGVASLVSESPRVDVWDRDSLAAIQKN